MIFWTGFAIQRIGYLTMELTNDLLVRPCRRGRLSDKGGAIDELIAEGARQAGRPDASLHPATHTQDQTQQRTSISTLKTDVDHRVSTAISPPR